MTDAELDAMVDEIITTLDPRLLRGIVLDWLHTCRRTDKPMTE